MSFTALSNKVTISLEEPLSWADFNASLASFNVSSCFLRDSAFLSSSAFNASVSFLRASTSSPKSSALSWSFSDAGRAASAFSAFSIPALTPWGRASLVLASAAGVVDELPAVASSFSNSLRISPAFKSPDSIAFNNPSLSTNSLAAFLATSLLVIFGSFVIDSSNWFKAFDKASLESASSFLASSSFFASSLALASASAAFCLAAANSSSAVFLASSALVFAASASAASFFSVSSFVAASLAAGVAVSTFAWASVTFSSAFLASASACLISEFVTSDLGVSAVPVSPAGCVAAGCVVSASLAWAITDPVVATPSPTRTEATPTLNLRNEYFLFVSIKNPLFKNIIMTVFLKCLFWSCKQNFQRRLMY